MNEREMFTQMLEHFGMPKNCVPVDAMTVDTDTPGLVTFTWDREYVLDADGWVVHDRDGFKTRPGGSITLVAVNA